MRPVIASVAREQSEILMMEGIRYMKEIIYLVWIVFSLAMCSGIAVEHPVMEREGGMRYYLNVLGVGQGAYWLGNFLFDIALFAFQAAIMVVLVYPLNLSSYQESIYDFAALMALFGPAHTLFSYMISFAFTNPQTALKFISLVYMIAGFILPFVLKLISFGIDRCEGPVYVTTQMFAQAIPL